ncbi:hypothetical protein M407DRAFT_3705 [Tulasnella calospora MUT 4182]|uniref:Uncharacterized protein n=1 Tax=Tulasnella calospora MUT 4182 TaxID=1051891 RepID=A0A0C3QM36_9AGAM|nr:hypothetical protein M407DRAFT_3705 [Tulasnella calospora MUT 4182]
MAQSSKALGKRKADPSSDSESSTSGSDSEALAMLQVQGQAFLQSFGNAIPELLPTKVAKKKPRIEDTPSLEEADEEWCGLDSEDEVPSIKERARRPKRASESGVKVTPDPASNVVVFSEPRGSVSTSISKRDAKALMSSKVSKIHSTPGADDDQPTEADGEQEQSLNLKDKELFRLLHTRLLAGTTSSAVHQTNGERRRALQGRVIELAGGAKVGHGLKVLHHQYKVHQPKRTRDVIEKKEQATDAARKAEFEENGIFHKDNKKSLFLQVRKHKTKPRLGGIGEGIGKYKDGTLTLSKAEIASITGTSSGGGSKKGRDRKRR